MKRACPMMSPRPDRVGHVATPPTVADLYSGAGGLSEGLRQVGFKIVFGIDKDPEACRTFQLNHPDADVECASITSLSPGDIAQRVGGYVDLVVGGPSCQGFSTAGRRTGWVRDDDDRNDLWSHMLAVVEKIQPKAFIMENVPGLFAWKEGEFGWKIIQAFRELGFLVTHDILLAANYGVPQLRRRLFIVGVRDGGSFRFPSETHLGGWRRDTLHLWEEARVQRGLRPHVTAWEAIADLPALGDSSGAPSMRYGHIRTTPIIEHLRAGAGDRVRDHETGNLPEATRELLRQVPRGGTWRDIPTRDLPQRFQGMRRTDSTNLYGRLDPARAAYTINTQFLNVTTGCYTHPFEDRALTIREGARLQTFPDRYEFTGTLSSRARQIGNAVPPLLGAVLGASLAEQLPEWRERGITVAPVVEPADRQPSLRRSSTHIVRAKGARHGAMSLDLELRRALHARGLRFRVNARPIPEVERQPAIVFVGAKVAVFLDECFWNGCEEHTRTTTKSYRLWWKKDIERNKERDAAATTLLMNEGWQVVRLWEHVGVDEALHTVVAALDKTHPDTIAG